MQHLVGLWLAIQYSVKITANLFLILENTEQITLNINMPY